MKNRIFALVMAVMMLVASVAMGEAAAKLSGEFTGTAQGFGGDVTVTLTFVNDEWTDIAIEGAA
jgi:fumarate reductase flavoprotein subunit